MIRMFTLCLLALSLVACGGGSSTPNLPTNGASFSVVGTWVGAATDDGDISNDTSDDINKSIKLVINKDAADVTGKGVSGSLTIDGIGDLSFTDSYVAALAGASRVAVIEASDSQGYLYTLRITFTEKRADGGQLSSSNPVLETDKRVFLTTTLVKQ